MWKGALRRGMACLAGVLLYLWVLQLQLDEDDFAEVDAIGQIGRTKCEGMPILSVHRRWSKPIASRLLSASASSPVLHPVFPVSPAMSPHTVDPPAKSLTAAPAPKSLTAAPAPLLIASVSAPQPATARNPSTKVGTSTPSNINRPHSPTSSLPLPVLPSPALAPPLTQPRSQASAASPISRNLPAAQSPFPASNSPAPPPSSPPLLSRPSGVAPSTASSFPSASSPILSSPSLDSPPTGNASSSDSPTTSPSSGCCRLDMVPRPGLPTNSCVCVYPIRLELLVDNVSVTFVNWSGEFQQELASQLDVKVFQIEITSFHFNGLNLSLKIVIGPLANESFSREQAETIETDLDHFKVRFNSSLFGNYTLQQFRYFEPPVPPPVQTPASGMPPSAVSQMLPKSAPINRQNGHTLALQYIVAIAAGAVIVVSVLAIISWRYLLPCKAMKKTYRCCVQGVCSRATSSPFDTILYDTRSIPRSSTTRLFTFDELKQATSNFDLANVLGEGGFGRVYKGVLKDGTAVAIKRLTGGGQGDREFLVEVEMLSRLHHRNLVKLVGYYTSRDSTQHLLCYELVPNGSLEAWLHGPLGADQPLEWDIRMKIALDAARGLAYLHEDSQPCVIHRDFKASNILIENDFHAKVADFGLAKQAPEGQINYVSTRVMGTFGYVAPEYAMTGHLLVKSDVYSYGVVLLELLSGRKPVDMSQPSGEENLVTWARPILRDKERFEELADPRLFGKYPREDFAQVAAIAAVCVAPEAGQRPTMGEVVQSLKLVARSSEYPTSGERNPSPDIVMATNLSNKSLMPNARPTSAVFESDGSSSVFSSGPFSGPSVLENDFLSRTALFSEDLHEGR